LIALQNNNGGMEDVNQSILQMKDKVSVFLEEVRQLEL
jgi:hypothetical protein